MAMYKFKLTGKREGQTIVLLDRYSFLKGEMVVSGKDAKLAKPILVDFYACTLERVPDAEVEPTDGVTVESDDDVVDVTTAPPVLKESAKVMSTKDEARAK